MNNKIKTLLHGFGAIAITATPIITAISCNSEDPDFKRWISSMQKHTFTHQKDLFDITKLSPSMIYDATIIEWIDGDTPKVKLDKPLEGNSEWKIRISSIDTPELHVKITSNGSERWVDTTGEEYKWAKKAKDYGNKVMPKGTKIKIFSNGGKTYNRITGSIFYNPISLDNIDMYKSYSVDILNQGLAMALVDNPQDVLIKNTKSLSLIGLALADAYNDAAKNRRGLFSVNYKSILKEHGITNDLTVRWRGTNKPLDSTEMNIYDWLGIKQESK